MDTELTHQAEQQLTELAEQFAHWRATKVNRSARIPEALWAEVLRLCEVLPRSRLQRRLRLSSRDIRKRQGLDVPKRQRQHSRPAPVAAAFVEVTEALSPSPPLASTGAELVFERADGARLQLRFSGAVADLTPVVQSFWATR